MADFKFEIGDLVKVDSATIQNQPGVIVDRWSIKAIDEGRRAGYTVSLTNLNNTMIECYEGELQMYAPESTEGDSTEEFVFGVSMCGPSAITGTFGYWANAFAQNTKSLILAKSAEEAAMQFCKDQQLSGEHKILVLDKGKMRAFRLKLLPSLAELEAPNAG